MDDSERLESRIYHALRDDYISVGWKVGESEERILRRDAKVCAEAVLRWHDAVTGALQARSRILGDLLNSTEEIGGEVVLNLSGLTTEHRKFVREAIRAGELPTRSRPRRVSAAGST